MKRKLEISENPEDVDTECGKPAARSDNARTPKFVPKVQQMAEQNPKKSIRSLDRELGAGNATIHRIVHKDLRYSSYIWKHGYFTN